MIDSEYCEFLKRTNYSIDEITDKTRAYMVMCTGLEIIHQSELLDCRSLVRLDHYEDKYNIKHEIMHHMGQDVHCFT